MENYYKTLGVSEDADAKEIKAKYRKLAMKYHPDRNPDDKNAEEMFKTVSEAYEILGDENKRKEYDEKRKNKRNSNNSQRFDGKKSSRAEQNSESAKRGAEAFFRNFSANPNDIKNMFESAKDGLKEGVKPEKNIFREVSSELKPKKVGWNIIKEKLKKATVNYEVYDYINHHVPEHRNFLKFFYPSNNRYRRSIEYMKNNKYLIMTEKDNTKPLF